VLATACAIVACGLAQTSLASAAPLSIRIEGNHFVNGAGQTIRLLGVNHASAEYACSEGFGYNSGHMDAADAAAIASWNADAVRVPLNEDCWLGINNQPNNSQDPGETLTSAGYREAVESYIADLNAHGLYAILDLHWSAPGTQVAEEQQPMPDNDHSPAFWQSVASTFKANPAVVFDIFNEPYDPTDPRSGSDPAPQDQVTWNCWDTGTKNGPAGGAPCDTSAYDDNEVKTTTYQVAGLQTLVNAIRGAGATQPVMAGGLNFANDLTGWVDHAPDDPLNQEAASFHNYMGQSCDDLSCWNSEIAPVAANVPVVTGEFDEDDFDNPSCANRTPSTFDADYMSWADQHGVSYLAWGWELLSAGEISSQKCNAFFLTSDPGGTPAAPNGTALHDHLLTLPPGGVTSVTPAPGSPAGGGPGAKGKSSIRLTTFHAHVEPGGAAIAFELRASQSCKGGLGGQTIKPFAAGSKGHKRHKVSLGTVNFKLTAGKAKTVVLKLPADARHLLAIKRSLAARFALTLSSPQSQRTVLHRRATLTEPVRHHHS
jgi:hypothetical protein